MAFVVVFFRGEEMDRRELSGPMVIGRAPECDLSVRDILMSRRHCKISPAEAGGWAIEDLGSKNGTRINGDAVTFAVLKDGAAIRMGNTQVKFYTGVMQAAPAAKKPGDSRRRPTDPFESLSGTVSDFQFVPQGSARDTSKLPTPRPHPADPSSYASEDIYTMLTEIASSSWDSIYATASGPAAVAVAGQKNRTLPKAGVKVAGEGVSAPAAAGMPPRRRLVVTDPCLQADHPTKVMPAVPSDSVLSDAPDHRRRWLAPVGSMWRGMKYVLTGRFLRRAS